MIFDKIAFVSVLKDNAANTALESYVAASGFQGPLLINTSAIRINIQAASPEKTVLAEGITGKLYEAYTQASGVREGMILTVSGTNQRYMVRGREEFPLPMGKHYELLLSKAELT